MLAYLLDTDICIHAMKGRSASLLKWLKANDGHLAVSDVSLFELRYGAENYADPSARLAVIESFLARIQLLPFDSQAAHHAGEIRAKLEREGRTIGAYDLMIAGTARSRGLILATNNRREYDRVEGLRVESLVVR